MCLKIILFFVAQVVIARPTPINSPPQETESVTFKILSFDDMLSDNVFDIKDDSSPHASTTKATTSRPRKRNNNAVVSGRVYETKIDIKGLSTTNEMANVDFPNSVDNLASSSNIKMSHSDPYYTIGVKVFVPDDALQTNPNDDENRSKVKDNEINRQSCFSTKKTPKWDQKKIKALLTEYLNVYKDLDYDLIYFSDQRTAFLTISNALKDKHGINVTHQQCENEYHHLKREVPKLSVTQMWTKSEMDEIEDLQKKIAEERAIRRSGKKVFAKTM